MAATATSPVTIPTKSEVLQWDTSHLDNLASYLDRAADRGELVGTRYVDAIRYPGGTAWIGPAADAAYDAASATHDLVSAQCGAIRDCAKIARRGGESINFAKRAAINAICSAEEDGFQVSENLTVTDVNAAPGRSGAAAGHAEDIHWRVADLVRTENHIASELQVAATELSNRRDIAQAIDFKQGPGSNSSDALPSPRPPGPNDENIPYGSDHRWSSKMSWGYKEAVVSLAKAEMMRNGQWTARDMLEHYLDNTGTAKTLPSDKVDSWLATDTTAYSGTQAPAVTTQRNLNQLQQQALAQARATGAPVTLSGNTPWETVAGSDGDCVRTLGHFSMSTAYDVTVNPDGSYKTTYRNDVYDWYNFATHPYGSSVANQISTYAHDLEAVGHAQDFLITGSGTVHTAQGVLP